MRIFDGAKKALNAVRHGVEQATQRTQQAVGGAVRQGGRVLNQAVDTFEGQAAQGVRKVADLFGGKSPDKVYDGHLVGAGGRTFPPGTSLQDIPGVTPRDNPNPSETIVYVNGISNDKDAQARSLQSLADKTGAKLVGVHNATEGQVKDLLQSVADKLDKGTNPAVDTLADTVYAELKAGRTVHLMGHSQGALITSRALTDVRNRLRIEDGLSKSQAEQLLSNVKVETFGGAAGKYPDGPQYVHYVNRGDMVPVLFGLGLDWNPLRHEGRGAVVHHFNQNLGHLSGTHGLEDVYLQHRVPFDEARAGHF